MKRILKQTALIPYRAITGEPLTSIEAMVFYLMVFTSVSLVYFGLRCIYPMTFQQYFI
jgi:hypothetical protein